MTQHRLRAVALSVLIVSVAMLIVSFASAKNHRTIFGPNLGGDFPAFYNAATILNHSGSNHLYDLKMQGDLYHTLLPDESPQTSLPYAYAPLVASAMRPLANYSYDFSYACWIVFSGVMFAVAIFFAMLAAGLPRKYWLTAILLALSFEPLAIECMHGGQISAIGLLAICGAIFFHRKNLNYLAGVSLSICLYKPTLLPIILPMLLLTRQWKVLGGFAWGTIIFSLACLATVGPHTCADYLRMLLHYTAQSTAGHSVFRTWKFVDLNAFFKLLNLPVPLIAVLWAGILTLAARVARQLWRSHNDSADSLLLAWAGALCLTMVINVYVGIYDTVLLIPAIICIAAFLIRRDQKLPRAFVMIAGLIYVLPWFSQLLARETGFNPLTLVILVLAAYIHRAMSMVSDNSQVPSTISTISSV